MVATGIKDASRKQVVIEEAIVPVSLLGLNNFTQEVISAGLAEVDETRQDLLFNVHATRVKVLPSLAELLDSSPTISGWNGLPRARQLELMQTGFLLPESIVLAWRVQALVAVLFFTHLLVGVAAWYSGVVFTEGGSCTRMQ